MTPPVKPINREAQEKYAATWQSWLLAKDEATKRQLEKTMDDLQPLIADSPKDPRWKQFIETLPGFEEFWESWGRCMERRIHLGR